MRFQDYICDITKRAADEAFRYAKAVPADKLEWSPLDNGRSVMDISRELAKCADWAYTIMSGTDEEWSEEVAAKQKAEMDAWTSIDQCETVCNQYLDKFFQFCRSWPDEKLLDTKWLRYDGGRDHTYEEMMDYPRWNFNYHLGQIAYIQTLLGDKEMH